MYSLQCLQRWTASAAEPPEVVAPTFELTVCPVTATEALPAPPWLPAPPVPLAWPSIPPPGPPPVLHPPGRFVLFGVGVKSRPKRGGHVTWGFGVLFHVLFFMSFIL